MNRIKPLLVMMILLASPAVHADGHNHMEAGCGSEHGSLAGQIIQSDRTKLIQQPMWAKSSSMIDITAIQRPKTSPVAMMYMEGKIIPASKAKSLTFDTGEETSPQP